MKLMRDEDILNESFRAKVIAEIRGKENVDRKTRDLRRYEVYKDRTRKWVIERLLNEFKPDTVAIMENRAANISICRKVINKLARSYSSGVERVAEPGTDSENITALANDMAFNTQMIKADRFSELFKNTQIGVLPKRDSFESEKLGRDIYRVCPTVLAPFLYDVIEDASDPTKARVVITSEFVERRMVTSAPGASLSAFDGERVNSGVGADLNNRSDGVDQIIADSREDAGINMRTFIWWAAKYHFTTDDKGKVIPSLSPKDLLNPISELPYVTMAEDQDGQFWADGSDDLVEGSILVNVLLTDMFGIASVQGWGQLVITGANPKDDIKGGPHIAIVLPASDDGKGADAKFITAAAPLESWMRMVEQYVALLLSTNNLSPRNVSAKLDGNSAASGIAMLIEQSESTQDVSEKQEQFSRIEPRVWQLIDKWMRIYAESGSLCEEQKALLPAQPIESVTLKFGETKQVVTEAERLQNLKLKKDLGIASMVDLIRADQPNLSEQDAEQKLLQIMVERLKMGAGSSEAQGTPPAQSTGMASGGGSETPPPSFL